MRRIVHLSDLHFGANSDIVMTSAIQSIKKLAPDIIIISGDLTQRARINQYDNVKKFLDRLRRITHNIIVIPGNHDINPLTTPIKRITDTYQRFHQYISEDVEPKYHDSVVAIVTTNTVIPAVIINGSTKPTSIKTTVNYLKKSTSLLNIVVTHHPLYLSFRHTVARKRIKARGSTKALDQLIDAGAMLLLSGHHHFPSIGIIKDKRGKCRALSGHGGTISDRIGKDGRWFTVFNINMPHLETQFFVYNDKAEKFVYGYKKNFCRKNGEWITSY